MKNICYNKIMNIKAQKIANKIKKYYSGNIDIAIVLGSGLSEFTKQLEIICEIPYSQFKELPLISVKGHAGKFVIGKIANKTVLVLNGRFHLYEGHSALTCVLNIWALKYLGVKNLILTTACGAINENYKAGEMMLMQDQINLTGTSPLIELNKFESGNKFISMLNPFDKTYTNNFYEIAKENKIKVHKGTFLQVLGPQYESKAEIEAYRALGADAVSMSTGIETIMANYLNIRILGVSCITNKTGKNAKLLTHEEVLENSHKILTNFNLIIKDFIKNLK